MAITGKSTISLKKKDLLSQKTPAIGFRKLMFAHKATVGDSIIDLSSLVTPTEMAGFTNPTSGELLEANLLFFRKNLTLVSSSKGVLVDYLSYTVNSNSEIVFTSSFGTAEDGEIFIGVIDPVAKTDGLIADTDYMVASGSLAATVTDISLGRSFKTNLNSSQQLGAVMVFLNGQLAFRNVGNATAAVAADGDYEELDNGFGEFSVIRLNVADPLNATPYLVVSSNLSTIRPDGSVLDMIENQQGTVDALVETVAVLAGVPETDFQATPSQPNLKQFGDRVITLESPTAMADALATKLGHKTYFHGTSYNGGVAPTVTLGGSPSPGSVGITRGIFVPYQMQDGTWWIRGRVAATFSSQAYNNISWAINGITFKNASNLEQPTIVNSGLGNGHATVSATIPNTSTIFSNFNTTNPTGAASTITRASLWFDVELESKPTWAY